MDSFHPLLKSLEVLHVEKVVDKMQADVVGDRQEWLLRRVEMIQALIFDGRHSLGDRLVQVAVHTSDKISRDTGEEKYATNGFTVVD